MQWPVYNPSPSRVLRTSSHDFYCLIRSIMRRLHSRNLKESLPGPRVSKETYSSVERDLLNCQPQRKSSTRCKKCLLISDSWLAPCSTRNTPHHLGPPPVWPFPRSRFHNLWPVFSCTLRCRASSSEALPRKYTCTIALWGEGGSKRIGHSCLAASPESSETVALK